MVALRIIIGIVVIVFFLWLIAPSSKTGQDEESDKDAGRVRRIGFLVGYLRSRNRPK